MSLTVDFGDAGSFRRDAERAMSVPLGLANPFWLVFGAAATAGLTWWWVNRLVRSTNLQARGQEAGAIYEMAEATASTTPAHARRNRKIPVETADDGADFDEAESMYANAEFAEADYVDADAAGYPRVTLEPTVPDEARYAQHESEIPTTASENADHAGYPVVAPGPAAAESADDLTRLAGVGPRIAEGLARHGVTRFAHLAAWTSDQLADFDRSMNLRGRAVRSDWIAQAQALAAQTPSA